jgi:uncharacterized membrane protein
MDTLLIYFNSTQDVNIFFLLLGICIGMLIILTAYFLSKF